MDMCHSAAVAYTSAIDPKGLEFILGVFDGLACDGGAPSGLLEIVVIKVLGSRPANEKLRRTHELGRAGRRIKYVGHVPKKSDRGIVVIAV